MSKFIEVNIITELMDAELNKTIRMDTVTINSDKILIIGDVDGRASILMCDDEGTLNCQESYEEVKRMIENE